MGANHFSNLVGLSIGATTIKKLGGTSAVQLFMASAVARAYAGGLGAVPPVGSRGKAPGRGSGGRSPPEADDNSLLQGHICY
jgi:hypothetical protein